MRGWLSAAAATVSGTAYNPCHVHLQPRSAATACNARNVEAGSSLLSVVQRHNVVMPRAHHTRVAVHVLDVSQPQRPAGCTSGPAGGGAAHQHLREFARRQHTIDLVACRLSSSRVQARLCCMQHADPMRCRAAKVGVPWKQTESMAKRLCSCRMTVMYRPSTTPCSRSPVVDSSNCGRRCSMVLACCAGRTAAAAGARRQQAAAAATLGGPTLPSQALRALPTKCQVGPGAGSDDPIEAPATHGCRSCKVLQAGHAGAVGSG